MARDDWRLRIELEEDAHADGLLERLGLVRSEADELAGELEDSRLAVTHDDGTVFVYAATSLELNSAQGVIERELDELGLKPRLMRAEHWLAEEERWDDEPAGPDDDEQVLAEGYAP